MPAKSKTIAPIRDNGTDSYIRNVCADLEGAYDREALNLIFRHGVLAVESSEISEAVDRMRDAEPIRTKLQALYDEIQPALPAEMRIRLTRYDDMQNEKQESAVDSAYLLGIAVGRRLGPGALTLRKGGAR